MSGATDLEARWWLNCWPSRFVGRPSPPDSLTYVRDQLGHSSIKMTVDVYGHLVPGANRQAVDRLDDATGRNLYATNWSEGETRSEEPRGVTSRPEYFLTKLREGSRAAKT